MTAVGYGSVDEKPSRLEAIDYILYAFLTALSIFCSFLLFFLYFFRSSLVFTNLKEYLILIYICKFLDPSISREPTVKY